MIKRSIHQDDTAILIVQEPTTYVKCFKQKLIEVKEEIDKFITIIRDFNTPFSTVDRTTIQKISNYIEANPTITQQDLCDI